MLATSAILKGRWAAALRPGFRPDATEMGPQSVGNYDDPPGRAPGPPRHNACLETNIGTLRRLSHLASPRPLWNSSFSTGTPLQMPPSHGAEVTPTKETGTEHLSGGLTQTRPAIIALP